MFDLPKTAANYAALSPISFLRRTAETFPHRTATIHGPHRQTWGETYERCRRLASALARAGVRRGDVVAIMAPNTPAMVEAHFGIPMLGAVLNALNTRLDPATIAYILGHGEARVVLVDREFAPVMRDALALLGGPAPLVVDSTTRSPPRTARPARPATKTSWPAATPATPPHCRPTSGTRSP